MEDGGVTTIEMRKDQAVELLLDAYEQMIEQSKDMRAEASSRNDMKSVASYDKSIENYTLARTNLSAAVSTVEMAQEKFARSKQGIDEVKKAIGFLESLCEDEKSVDRSIGGLKSAFGSDVGRFTQSTKKEEERVFEEFVSLSAGTRARYPQQYKPIEEWASHYTIYMPADMQIDENEIITEVQNAMNDATLSIENADLVAVLSTYEDLSPEYKDASINIKATLNNIKNKDSLENALRITGYLEEKLKSFTLEARTTFGGSRIIDFNSERAYVNEIETKIRQRVVNLEAEINQTMQAVNTKIQESHQKERDLLKYKNSAERYDELRSKLSAGGVLTVEENKEYKELEFLMEQMKDNGKVSIDEASQIEAGIRADKAEKKAGEESLLGPNDISEAKFKEEYPSEYAAICARANEIVMQEDKIGKFGHSYIENNPEKTNPEYENAMNARYHELVVSAIEEFKRSLERKQDNLEAEEKHERNVELFSIFGLKALDELRENGVLETYNPPEELNPSELKTVFEMIDHYTAMASMNPEDRALYRATHIPYKDRNGEMTTLIPRREDGSEITMDNLTPMEKAQLLSQMQIDQRHPEMQEMYDEYLYSMQESKSK